MAFAQTTLFRGGAFAQPAGGAPPAPNGLPSSLPQKLPASLRGALVSADGFDEEFVLAPGPNGTAAALTRQLLQRCEFDKNPQMVYSLSHAGPNYPANYMHCGQWTGGPCAMEKVCSADASVELPCEVAPSDFVREGDELVFRAGTVAYTTPPQSTGFGLGAVFREVVCRVDMIQELVEVNPEVDDPTVLNRTVINGLRVPVADVPWCHHADAEDPEEMSTGELCDEVPQDSEVGWYLRPLVDGYTAVPQQCSISFGHVILDVAVDACPTIYGMASVVYEDQATWIALKIAVPADGYPAILDASDATQATLSAHLSCNYAVLPNNMATAASQCCASDSVLCDDEASHRGLKDASEKPRFQEMDMDDIQIEHVEADVQFPRPAFFDGPIIVPAPEPSGEPIAPQLQGTDDVGVQQLP
eukprot:COSAG04_NODE_5817_length_1485_cov_2.174603_1_plen_415_part_10